MKIILTITMFALSINAFSQKLNKIYYDYSKTKLQAEYYTDAYGKMVGTFKGYSEYGGILLQGSYQDGAPIGKWIENYPDGKLHFIKIYDSPGIRLEVNNGKIIEYYANGSRSEKNYKNQELDGDYKFYDENGKLLRVGKYVNGVLILSEESQRIYDEEQEKLKKQQKEVEAANLKKNTEEYNKHMLIAGEAWDKKDYLKALTWYESASKLLENEKDAKGAISYIINTFVANSKFFVDYYKNDTVLSDFKILKADFKIKSVQEYNKSTYVYDVKNPTPSNYCNCLKPWDAEQYMVVSALNCFEINKEFYEPYQIAITEAFFKYKEALDQEGENYRNTKVRWEFKDLYTYEQDTFLKNLKVVKKNFELSKSVKTNFLKALENKNNITNLNEQNKKKTLLKKYLIVYEELISKINAYPGLTETISLLKSLNTFSDKVVGLYSQETKDIEKKLKDTETSDQIQAIILGQ